MFTTGVRRSSDDDVFNQKDVLHNIGCDLTQHNVESMKFLITDLVPPAPLEHLQDARDLIKYLEECDQLVLLPELLYTIGRHDLMMRYYNRSKREVETDLTTQPIVYISPYRKLLHAICEQLDSNDVADLKTLSYSKISENDLQWINTGYELFLALEKQGQIDEHNVEFLRNILMKSRRKVLSEMVKKYQLNIGSSPTGHIGAESGDGLAPPPYTAGHAQGDDNLISELSYGSDDMAEGGTHVTKEQLLKELDEMKEELKNLQTKQVASMRDEYCMTHSPRGHCVIINNMNFVTKKSYRNEGEIDCEALETRFRELDFMIMVKSNLNKEEVEALVHEYRHMDHSSYDCFVICVLCHGVRDHFLCVDDKAFSIQRLMRNFSAGNCPTLAGKPKLFFVQACPDVLDRIPETVDDNMKTEDENAIPDMGDMVLAQSWFQGNAAFRSKTEGSWFISTLCDVLYKYHSKLHLVDMLIKVNRRVADAKVQIGETFYNPFPVPIITLRKAVWFRSSADVC